jgi:4-amino-4-deoxy-L-arabinose transferase-like glycosyltransferase
MVAAETMGATPDALLIAAAALLLWTVAKLDSTQDGRWWLATGAAAGIAIAAKYTGFFLCCSLALWLWASPAARPWLRTIWPYAGASIALALFAPTVIWNVTHGFVSFQFQFGRVGVSHANAPYLLEFLDGQIALASPFILVLAAFGLVRNSSLAKPARLLGFAAANLWPALLYFTLHSLHDRVQGNWPCFVYPAMAILAAQALSVPGGNALSGKVVQVSRILALPVAGAVLTVAYAQAFFGVLPLGRRDPIARMTAIGFRPVAERIAMQALNEHVGAIITTNYAATSWIAFYAPPSVPVVVLTSDCRFSSSPHVTPALLRGRLLYVTQAPEREMIRVRDHFSRIALAGKIPRARHGIAIDAYYLYTVSGYHGAVAGRVP